jgi:hypothetical protein
MKVVSMIVVAALTLTACKGGGTPTSADPETDNDYQAFAELDNTAGAATIVAAHSELDGVTVSKFGSVGSGSGSETALLFSGSGIVAGNHTLTIVLDQQTGTVPTSYTVPKFDITLTACPAGALADTGLYLENLHEPAQTATLVAGQAIVYRFTSPDCLIP